MDYPKSVPSAGLVDGKFIDENPLTGTPGSLIPANWGNGVTQEILNVITAGDLTPDEKKYDQLLQAIRSVSSKGWTLDSALPIGSLPLPTIASAEGRLSVTVSAAATSGGKVTVPLGVPVSLGQEVVDGQLGRSRTFTTQSWTSADLLPNTGYFLRAQVIAGALTFYVQRGTPTDAVPASLKGTADGVGGGGFPSTSLDMCVAWILTGTVGTLPSVLTIYNRARLTWSQTVNGTGVIYLPLDPHARAARLTVGNPTPSAALVTNIGFSEVGWVGSSYTFLSPGTQAISGNPAGWTGKYPTVITTNNEVGDVTVSTLTASFDHSQLRSLWQTFQSQHGLGSTSALKDEALHGIGIKNHPVTDYTSGIGVNFSNAVNVHIVWELLR
ncbi:MULTISPECIES: phage tail protein [unclassified Pseudomonas]|uniref:phage tail protein n=1 Tax=unclassified Pseudomonas TaxID=196821 RepID=UPI000A1FD31B|nr:MULTISPECIES: phage tail protein [unclassified Pseudomonas]